MVLRGLQRRLSAGRSRWLIAVAASCLTVALLIAPPTAGAAVAGIATESSHHPPAKSHQPPGFPNLGPKASLPVWGQWMKEGIYTPTGRSLLNTDTYYGLPHQDTWLDTYFTDAAGQTFYLSTHHMEQGLNGEMTTPVGGISLGFQTDPLGQQMIPDPYFKEWLGYQTQALIANGDASYFIVDPTTSEELSFGANNFLWTSANAQLDIYGTLTAPGNSYYLPSPPPSVSKKPSAFLYGNVYYRVTGNYYGHEISGYAMVEELWSQMEYDSNWWMNKRTGNWIAWTNTYANGTTEYGQFFCMEHGYSGAIISNNRGQMLLDTHHLSATVQSTDLLGSPLSILYKFGNGQRFEYVGNPSHVVLPQKLLGTSLSDGSMEQLGSSSKIVHGDAIQLITGHIPASCT